MAQVDELDAALAAARNEATQGGDLDAALAAARSEASAPAAPAAPSAPRGEAAYQPTAFGGWPTGSAEGFKGVPAAVAKGAEWFGKNLYGSLQEVAAQPQQALAEFGRTAEATRRTIQEKLVGPSGQYAGPELSEQIAPPPTMATLPGQAIGALAGYAVPFGAGAKAGTTAARVLGAGETAGRLAASAAGGATAGYATTGDPLEALTAAAFATGIEGLMMFVPWAKGAWKAHKASQLRPDTMVGTPWGEMPKTQLIERLRTGGRQVQREYVAWTNKQSGVSPAEPLTPTPAGQEGMHPLARAGEPAPAQAVPASSVPAVPPAREAAVAVAKQQGAGLFEPPAPVVAPVVAPVAPAAGESAALDAAVALARQEAAVPLVATPEAPKVSEAQPAAQVSPEATQTQPEATPAAPGAAPTPGALRPGAIEHTAADAAIEAGMAERMGERVKTARAAEGTEGAVVGRARNVGKLETATLDDLRRRLERQLGRQKAEGSGPVFVADTVSQLDDVKAELARRAPPSPASPGAAGKAKEPWEMTRKALGATRKQVSGTADTLAVGDLISGTDDTKATYKHSDGRPFQANLNSYSVYEVTKVNDKSLRVKDLATGEEHTLQKESWRNYGKPARVTKWTGGEGMPRTHDEHRAAIESALAARKPVPPEVLADYPDLAAKYAPAPGEAPPAQAQPSPAAGEGAAQGKAGEAPAPDVARETRHIWSMERDEYVAQQKKAGQPARFAGQMHENAVAAASGAGADVPRKVLARYPNIASHPQYRGAYRDRTGQEPPTPQQIARGEKVGKNLYAFGTQLLAGDMRIASPEAPFTETSTGVQFYFADGFWYLRNPDSVAPYNEWKRVTDPKTNNRLEYLVNHGAPGEVTSEVPLGPKGVPSGEVPAAEPSPGGDVSVPAPTGVPEKTRAAIETRVRQLGNAQAVRDVFVSNTPGAKYARDLAEALYGAPAAPTGPTHAIVPGQGSTGEIPHGPARAEELRAAAEAEQERIDPATLAKAVNIGRTLLNGGFVDASEWSAAMLDATQSQSIKPYLKPVYEALRGEGGPNVPNMTPPEDFPGIPGKGIMGRPDLAQLGTTPEAQAVGSVVDELSKGEPAVERATHDTLKAQAETAVAANPAAEKARLLQMVGQGKTFSDLDATISNVLSDREAVRMLGATDPADMIDASQTLRAFRKGRGDIGASLAALARAGGLTPAERMRKAIADAMIEPPPKWQKRIDKANKTGNPDEAARIEQDWDRKLLAFREAVKRTGIDWDTVVAGTVDERTAAVVFRALSIMKGTKWSWTEELYRNIILSGPHTQVVNFSSNEINFWRYFTANKALEAIITSTFRLQHGTRVTDLIAAWKDYAPAVAYAAQIGWQSFVTEMPTIEQRTGTRAGEKYEGRVTIGGTPGRAIRYPQRGLQMMDEFAVAKVAYMEAKIQARGIARREGLTQGTPEFDARVAELHADLHSPAWQEGMKLGEELAMHGEPGLLTRGMLALRRKIPGSFFVFPFINFPVQAFKAGVKVMTPYHTLAEVGRLLMAPLRAGGAEGGPRPKWGAAAAADVLAGTLLYLVIGQKDDNPWITGSDGINGQHRYCLNFSGLGLGWVPYNRVEPWGTALAIMADIGLGIRSGDVDAVVKRGGGGVVKQMTDKTFLQGLGDLFRIVKSFTEPSGSPTAQAADLVANFASSWVPNIIQQPIQSFRQFVPERRTYGKGSDKAKMAFQRAWQGTELTMLDVPKVDIWGRDQLPNGTQGLKTDFLFKLLLPFNAAARAPFVGDRAIYRWNVTHPNAEVKIEAPSRDFRYNNTTHYLDDEEYHAFCKLVGETAKGAVDQWESKYAGTPASFAADTLPAVRIEQLRGIFTRAKEYARTRLRPGWLKERFPLAPVPAPPLRGPSYYETLPALPAGSPKWQEPRG